MVSSLLLLMTSFLSSTQRFISNGQFTNTNNWVPSLIFTYILRSPNSFARPKASKVSNKYVASRKPIAVSTWVCKSQVRRLKLWETQRPKSPNTSLQSKVNWAYNPLKPLEQSTTHSSDLPWFITSLQFMLPIWSQLKKSRDTRPTFVEKNSDFQIAPMRKLLTTSQLGTSSKYHKKLTTSTRKWYCVRNQHLPLNQYLLLLQELIKRSSPSEKIFVTSW